MRRVAVADPEAAMTLRRMLPGTGRRVEVLSGPDAATELTATSTAETVLNGITGAVGLGPTLAALGSGATLALANKESLVAAARWRQHGDAGRWSRALRWRGRRAGPGRSTGSRAHRVGRPVPRRRLAELSEVTLDQALAHPTWDMGPMVTINSATLMNKGLEVIEAHLLFGIPYERIDVVVHPQSVVHSMVTFVDGSTLAQASPPDMRLPIGLALAWPERLPGRRCRAGGTQRRAGPSSRSTTTRSPVCGSPPLGRWADASAVLNAVTRRPSARS